MHSRPIWLMLMMTCHVMVAAPSFGNRPGFVFLDHVIDEGVLQAIAIDLRLDESQQAALDPHFALYWDLVTTIEADAGKEMDSIRAWRTALNVTDGDAAIAADAECDTKTNELRSNSNQRSDKLLLDFYAGARPFSAAISWPSFRRRSAVFAGSIGLTLRPRPLAHRSPNTLT